MITDYGYVGIFLIFGVLLVAAAFITSWLLRPHNPTPLKNSPYECGEKIKGVAWIQFNIRYYLIALIFVVFDVEALFLVPWAVALGELGLTAYIEMVIFILILIAGLFYAYKKGALEWL